MPLRVGIDLVQVRQVTQSLRRFGSRYVRRVFTEDEIAYCRAGRASAAERFAARFAAKEAALKVLRPAADDAGIDPRSIEVKRSDGGGCDLILHGAARALAERQGIASLAVSLSHEAGYATAVVIAELNAPAPRRQRTRTRTAKGSA